MKYVYTVLMSRDGHKRQFSGSACLAQHPHSFSVGATHFSPPPSHSPTAAPPLPPQVIVYSDENCLEEMEEASVLLLVSDCSEEAGEEVCGTCRAPVRALD